MLSGKHKRSLIFYIILTIWTTYCLILSHAKFFSGKYEIAGGDTTWHNQIHYNFMLGRNFEMSHSCWPGGGTGDIIPGHCNYLTNHVFLTTILVAPLYKLYDSPFLLHAILIIINVWVGSWLLLCVLRLKTNSFIAYLFTGIYMFWGVIYAIAFDKFYPPMLSITALLALLYAIYTGRNLLYWLTVC